MDTLNEALTIIYIDESLKSLTAEKFQSLLRSLKKPTASSLNATSKLLPQKELSDIKTYATKKDPSFKKEFDIERKKATNIHEDNKDLYSLMMVSTKRLKILAREKAGSKAEKMVDKMLLKIGEFFKESGKNILVVGIILKLISIYCTEIYGIIKAYPVLLELFKLSLFASQYAVPIAIAGLIILILGFLLLEWHKSREEERKYKSGGKTANPYEE